MLAADRAAPGTGLPQGLVLRLEEIAGGTRAGGRVSSFG